MLLLGGVVVGVVAALGGGDDDEPRGATTTSTTVAEISETGQELIDRLALGRERPLHLRLEQTEPDEAGGRMIVEIWRDGDQIRQDVAYEAEELSSTVAAFQLADGDYVCQQAESEWECQQIRSAATEAGEPGGIVESAAEEVAGNDVVSTDETVGDREARCYDIDGAEGQSTICVTDDGIPVRMVYQGRQLTAEVVEHEVDASVFDLPGEVVTPTVPSEGTETST